jgi:hypothetical protein
VSIALIQRSSAPPSISKRWKSIISSSRRAISSSSRFDEYSVPSNSRAMLKRLHPSPQRTSRVLSNKSAGIIHPIHDSHCRSLELKEDYERLKEEAERAAEASTFTYHKQRGIRAEIKQYEEQEAEAERYKRTVEDRVPPQTTPKS